MRERDRVAVVVLCWCGTPWDATACPPDLRVVALDRFGDRARARSRTRPTIWRRHHSDPTAPSSPVGETCPASRGARATHAGSRSAAKLYAITPACCTAP